MEVAEEDGHAPPVHEDVVRVPDQGVAVVGGKVVYAAGPFARLDANPPPPAMPDWSPVRSFKGYAAWGEPPPRDDAALARVAAAGCGCGSGGGGRRGSRRRCPRSRGG